MLRYVNLMGEQIDKVEQAINRLKLFEPEDGYYLAFSGGKDSCCIKELAIMAGVKFDAHYHVTTVDPPELTRFILKHHPDVIWDRPSLPMRKLIVTKNYPPTRVSRYCCQYLKEGGGMWRVVVTGVRWAESPRRRRRHGVVRVGEKDKSIIMNDDNDESREIVDQCYRTKKTMINPIVDWLDEDVWEFIRERNLPYCSLYDEGFSRLGCVGCPMAGESRFRQFERWPQYKRLYINAFSEMLKNRAEKGRDSKTWTSGEEVFAWWMGKGGEESNPDQVGFDDEDE